MRRAVIIDTDPSPDDAVTILMALAAPDEIELLAVTTVAGNVPLALTTKNALRTLELVRRTEIPVYAGAAGPIDEPLETAEYVHGKTGFDGYDLPEPTTEPAPGFAADAIVDLVMARPAKTVTLCAIAPLTNIALALAKEPRLAGHLQEIVLMGGARAEGGNVTPAAEYNIYVDPVAAHRVLSCGAAITLIPLDVTHKARTTAARMERLRAVDTPLAEAFYHLLTFNKRYDEAHYGWDGGPLHDPTTVAYLLRPELFSGRRVHVAVERTSALTRGMTVIDWWSVTGRPANALVLDEIDADGYFDLVIGSFARL